MSKRVLLTGASGFIGSHCVDYFLKKTNWHIICLDSFRNKGCYTRLDGVFDRHPNYKSRTTVVRADLSVPITPQVENLLLARSLDDRGHIVEKRIDYIINMASDSAVERSTTDPVHCLRNNYELAINMLEFARAIKPSLFVQISTDEVYGQAKPNQAHKEWDVILPSNPYAASKAAQEAMAIAYWRTYGVPVIITNCMNLIGETQDPEKFLPKIIQMVATNKEMPIYADSKKEIGTRFYLHAANMADALVYLTSLTPAKYPNSQMPDRYNICGDVELNNLEMAQLVAKLMGKKLKYKFVQSESARPGYDRRYALDGSKMKSLGWTPPIPFEESLKGIIEWTLKNQHWML